VDHTNTVHSIPQCVLLTSVPACPGTTSSPEEAVPQAAAVNFSYIWRRGGASTSQLLCRTTTHQGTQGHVKVVRKEAAAVDGRPWSMDGGLDAAAIGGDQPVLAITTPPHGAALMYLETYSSTMQGRGGGQHMLAAKAHIGQSTHRHMQLSGGGQVAGHLLP
jgi:hypothetical protein